MGQTLRVIQRKLYTVLTICFVMVFWGGTADLYSQQVWTYDFGDETGSFTSGDEINPTLLPSTQTDGGDTRLRIGGGNEIILSDTGNDVGSFSRMILEGSPTGALNIFGIGRADAESNDLLYLRASIRISISEAENENQYFLVLNSENGFDQTNIDAGTLFGGLRFTVQQDGEIEVARRSGSGTGTWTDTFDFGTGLIGLDEEIVLEIYANNSSSTVSYFRNSEEISIDNGFYAVYLNGTRISGSSGNGNAAKVGDFTEGASISSVRFMGGATGGGESQIEIDDIVYSNSLPDLRTIESKDGNAGWRMLASPYDGFNVDQLSRQNLVQGIAVGDYDNDYSGNDLNVYNGYDGSNWVAADNVTNTLDRGNGFIWYMHDTETGVVENKPLPLDFYTIGSKDAGDVTVNLHADGDEKWNLLGNPFSEDLDVSGINGWAQTGSLQNATVQIWDGESYIASTANDDKVAASQGFFLENNDANQLLIPANATTDGASFNKTSKEASRLIALKLEGSEGINSYTDRAFTFYFHEDAEDGWDLWDASKLTPLLNNYVNLAFVGERDNESRLKAQESRPYNPDNFEVPARLISAGVDGKFTLGIQKKVNIPDGWIVEVTDHETGTVTNLMEDDYHFEATSNHSEKNLNRSKVAPEVATMNKSIGDNRFTFQVTTAASSPVDPDGELPDHVALEQNYPNPFNPATVINYDIPEQSHVRLAVYDLIGRQVDLLVNETRAAGRYNITWDASQLSSGVYIYRLETAGQTLTRQMTLIK